MTLKEIIKSCSKLRLYEERLVKDEYCELVFYKNEVDQWDKLCADMLGAAVKPAGIKPAENEWRMAEDFGGVYKEQTLFKKDFDDGTVLALFWPWEDGIHITLKLAYKKK